MSISRFVLRSDWLVNRTAEELTNDLIVGVRWCREELGDHPSVQVLLHSNEENTDFLIPPLPNLLYIRDSFSIINEKVFIWQMLHQVRQNETLIVRTIFQFHKRFVSLQLVDWTGSAEKGFLSIEGGDIAYLGSNELLIGLSERTNRLAIDTLCRTHLFETVIVIQLPRKRSYMHLDMILCQVARDLFTFHQPLKDPLEVFHLQIDQAEVGCLFVVDRSTRDLLP